jgi:hypothetical protein
MTSTSHPFISPNHDVRNVFSPDRNRQREGEKEREREMERIWKRGGGSGRATKGEREGWRKEQREGIERVKEERI